MTLNYSLFLFICYNVVLIFFIYTEIRLVNANENINNKTISSIFTKSNDYKASIAICLTGNIRRLEIGSKIQNMIIPNLLNHIHIDLFILLESPRLRTDASFDKYIPLYDTFTESDLEKIVRARTIETMKTINDTLDFNFNVYVKFAEPQLHYHAVAGKVPIQTGYAFYRNSHQQFEATFRQFNGIRHCVQWAQENEIINRKFYDFFIRFREDTYVLNTWNFKIDSWRNHVVVSNFNGYGGICDRWFVVSRQFVDKFLRGLVEHYYLEQDVIGLEWYNTEDLIAKSLRKQPIPLIELGLCDIPLITIRELLNTTHWKLCHVAAKEHVSSTSKCVVENRWKRYFSNDAVPLSSLEVLKDKESQLKIAKHRSSIVKVTKHRGDPKNPNSLEFYVLFQDDYKWKWEKWVEVKSSPILHEYLRTVHLQKLLHKSARIV